MTFPEPEEVRRRRFRYLPTPTWGGFFRKNIPFRMGPRVRQHIEEEEYRGDFWNLINGRRILRRLNLQDLTQAQRLRRQRLYELERLAGRGPVVPTRRLKRNPATGALQYGSSGKFPKPSTSIPTPTSTAPPGSPRRGAIRWRPHKAAVPPLTPSRLSERKWKVPMGRKDPFPREVSRYPIGNRQSWLRSYYRANPIAARNARNEARRIINWAHTHL